MNFTDVKINFHSGVRCLKPSFGLTGSKRLLSCNSKTLVLIFANKASIYEENCQNKYQNIPSIRGLGPKDQFQTNWTQETYQAISPQPYFQLSQTRPGHNLDLSCVRQSDAAPFCKNYAKLYFEAKHLEKGLNSGW